MKKLLLTIALVLMLVNQTDHQQHLTGYVKEHVEVVQSNKAVFTTWEGNESIETNMLKRHIESICDDMPFIEPQHNKIYRQLLVGTAAIESDLGLNITPKGTSRGIYQLTISTVKDYYKRVFPQFDGMEESVDAYRDKSKSLAWNVTYNVEFQTAFTLAYYYTTLEMKDIDIETLASKKEQAKVYKKYFNTYRGASTVRKYLVKQKIYLEANSGRSS